jgi:hypothetical protein
MNRKVKNTLGIVGLLLIISILGFGYIFIFQRNSIKKDEQEKAKLIKEVKEPEVLEAERNELAKKAAEIDSILNARKFNIPKALSSIKFFDFVNRETSSFSDKAKINVEYVDKKDDRNFFYYSYKVYGQAQFSELYQLITGIEQSKELKKVRSITLSSMVANVEGGKPDYLVNFTMLVAVYFSADDRFASSTLVENKFQYKSVYNFFYPLIRNDIPPNVDNLLDVQGAKLLALIPEGAFVADASGNTFLLYEGQEVYLGYLTKIDYESNKVSFILNKGGIIEKVDLQLQREDKTGKKER